MKTVKNPRKSCDFCYRRRFKCNGAKPCCSHCTTEGIDCTYEAPSRKYTPKKRRSSAKSGDGNDQVPDRLLQLEALVEQLTERVDSAERLNETPARVQRQRRERRDAETLPPVTVASPDEGEITDYPKSPPSMSLPPLRQVAAIAETFLERFNAVLPLFGANALLHLVQNMYRVEIHQRDPVAWAAVNVVLALAHRHNLVGNGGIDGSLMYLSRAESVLSTVILGDLELLNIQVLVGIVMLRVASPDLRHARILIATTMRLAHELGLHNRTLSAHLDPADARDRSCVFWMAYILDKDISMRSKQPAIQLDDDIDLEFPCYGFDAHQLTGEASTGIGVISTADGSARMNYFETRIRLAVIEGAVYDYAFSTRSQKRSAEERSSALASVTHALQQWKDSVPPEFSAAMAVGRVCPSTLDCLGILHSVSLACTSLLNQATAWNAQWMTSIHRYAMDGTVPTLPSQWLALVDEARNLAVLLEALPMHERANFWITGCTHMTAMLLLTVKSMQVTPYDQLSLDRKLIGAGLRKLDRVLEEVQSEVIRTFRDTCAELNEMTQRRRAEAEQVADNTEMSTYLLDV